MLPFTKKKTTALGNSRKAQQILAIQIARAMVKVDTEMKKGFYNQWHTFKKFLPFLSFFIPRKSFYLTWKYGQIEQHVHLSSPMLVHTLHANWVNIPFSNVVSCGVSGADGEMPELWSYHIQISTYLCLFLSFSRFIHVTSFKWTYSYESGNILYLTIET